MQGTEELLGLLRERGKRGLPIKRVYRMLYNTNLYLSAYGRVYRNAGAMTPGGTEETADGTSLETFETIITALKQERYQWQPARRTYILKKNGKKRPLGIPVWSDKLLAEVMRMILNAYFDGTFSEHSHGFREGRGCHTALREVYQIWQGTVWIIEGDIADCFGSLDHNLIISALAEPIQDGRFLNLVKKLLDAGYLEDWKLNNTFSGVPQGSILSPILSNILLSKLDRFVETELIPEYTRGKKKRPNQEYNRLINRARKRYNKGQKEAAHKLKQQAQKLPSIDPQDPDFRRLRYVRYADDLALSFVGPKEEAEAIKQRLRAFLLEELKLNLSDEKTLITHTRDSAAKFLNYEITTLHCDTKQTRDKNGRRGRSINGGIGLKVPRKVIEDKCKRYMRKGKPSHRAELLNESDFTIIATYQLEYRGLVNYYRMAYNLYTLRKLKWVMEQSLTKTLASKHKISVSKVYKKCKAEIDVEGKKYKGLQVTVSREGKKPLVATWGGIPLTWDVTAPIEDEMRQYAWKRSELERRLLAQTCEQCGATRMTAQIEVHHIRALKDLNRYTGREKPQWVHIMASRRRKTLVLCHTCHMDIQHGRPQRRAVSRTRTGST
ncbi:reverse transcriptase domain-containing protein [Ktedonobacter sp. SOSP1-52]|uniref:reverse transcriptase domain-containing protein n=1 Tax=Ktedonobacter sp. SOSP1-52 TaxID=2778366 RepID=UPI00191641D0|nr:reverse transcriptase domain-containing protein [Ktedonobacter sp. SOSP1-52]